MDSQEDIRKQTKKQKRCCSIAQPVNLVQPCRCKKAQYTRQKKNKNTKQKKKRIDVASMLCCSPWSNHADVKNTVHKTEKKTRKKPENSTAHPGPTMQMSDSFPFVFPISVLSFCRRKSIIVCWAVKNIKVKKKMKKEKNREFLQIIMFDCLSAFFPQSPCINFLADECM